MESTTQFAETDLGREYAYLYGVNEKSEVFMRAWSFGWRTLASESWSIDQARLYLGDSWDPVAAIGLDSVWVATQSEMHEYSAVPVGADRAALSRALAGGIRAAGEIIAGLDLADAAREIAALKTFQGETSSRIGKLEAQIQALVRNGAAAVDQRNSAEVLAAVRDLIAQAQSINKRN